MRGLSRHSINAKADLSRHSFSEGGCCGGWGRKTHGYPIRGRRPWYGLERLSPKTLKEFVDCVCAKTDCLHWNAFIRGMERSCKVEVFRQLHR